MSTRPVTTVSAPGNPLALEQQVCFRLVVASRTVLGVYRPVLKELGLTHPQYLVLLALWEEEPRTLSDLAHLLELDPGTLSRLLKRLEASGLIRRDRDRADERALAVVLTDSGRTLRERAVQVPATVVDKLGLDLSELTDLHAGLSRLIEAATLAVRDQPADEPT